MPDGLSVSLTKSPDVVPKLLRALDLSQISKAMIRPTQKAAVYVAENKLHGQVLGIVTGNLSRSLLPSVKAVNGVASFGTPLEYGATWEFGAGRKKARPWLAPGAKEFVGSGEYLRIFIDGIKRQLG